MKDTLYKFVDTEGYTYHNRRGFKYSLPTQNEDGSYTPGNWMRPKWGRFIKPRDVRVCGAYRLHLMKSIDARYASHNWVCYIAEGEGLIGKSEIQAAYRRVRLLEPVDMPSLAREGKLKGANLSRADLWEADLSGADLQKADLWEADLSGADLKGANLRGANLSEGNLRRVDLQEAYLQEANLHGADLRWANLSGANLRGANLSEGNLRGANLSGADLQWAYFDGATLTPQQREYLVSKGAVV